MSPCVLLGHVCSMRHSRLILRSQGAAKGGLEFIRMREQMRQIKQGDTPISKKCQEHASNIMQQPLVKRMFWFQSNLLTPTGPQRG